jgi:hypothetical protein
MAAGAVETAKEELVELSGMLAVQWRLTAEGRTAEAKENLKWIRSLAELIVARHAVDLTGDGWVKVVDVLARAGAILLKRFLL